jgi:hypothetical protein|tara:strand:- start:200 stop:919 length:720 start_codon:yes stop_codon:yes gene_type:complete
MGFLDHSTNNIIVDAVLTDRGRQALSRNDGSFSIYKFALADDEVDYQIIQQYGRTVGKEKIEKNTPIMEALTAGSLGMKYKLLAASNPFLTHLPLLTILAQNSASAGMISLKRGSSAATSTKSVTVTIENANNVAIDNDLRDNQIRVELNDLFLTVGEQAYSPDFKYSDNVAVYTVAMSPSSSGLGTSQQFNIKVKEFSNTVFANYSIAAGTYIRTFMTITGLNSGVSSQQEFQISNET